MKMRNITRRVQSSSQFFRAGSKSTAIQERLESRLLFSTFTVNTLTDPGFNQQGVVTLRNAVFDANVSGGSNTINFATSLFSGPGQKTLTLTQGDLELSDAGGTTTIQGPGAGALAISGGGVSRIFQIDASASVTISNVTLEDAVAPLDSDGVYEGGAIYNAGTLNLNTSTLLNDKAAGNSNTDPSGTSVAGGAIYSTGTLTVSHCTLSGNTAFGADLLQTANSNYSGEAAEGGAIFSSSGATLTITGSTLSSNSAVGGQGGASSLPDDVVAGAGGALGGAVLSEGKTTITSSTFTGNDADGGSNGSSGTASDPGSGGIALGGAIFSVSLSITSSTLSGNHANGGSGIFYNDNGAEGAGGAVWADGTLTISGSTLTGNGVSSGYSLYSQSPTAYGGAIYSGPFIFTNDAVLSLTQSTVSGNTATGGNGDYGGESSGIAGGPAEGGGIFSDGAATISQSAITTNTATGGIGNMGDGGPKLGAGAGGTAEGGGLYSEGTATVTDSTFANNTAAGGAGGSADMPGVPTPGGDGGSADGAGAYINSTFTLYDSTVTGNLSSGGKAGPGYTYPAGVPAPPIPPGKPGVASGGGLFVAGGKSLLLNTIVSGDHDGSTFADIAGTVSSSSSYNLIGVGGGLTNGSLGNKVGITNPDLSALAFNGGPTKTEAPLAGSPVINAGENPLIPAGVTTDQRGYSRIFGGTVDIGAVEFSTVTITGSVYNDINGDGVRQSSDPGLSGWQVYVDVGDTGAYASGDPVATTNSAGNYTLTYTAASSAPIIVREVRLNNYRRTQPAGLYPLGYYTLTLASQQSFSNITFGDSLTNLVTGTVFDDKNGNGVQNSGEAGFAGWTVEVDQLVSGKWKTDVFSTTTNTSGAYQFILGAGTYRIHDVVKSGYKPTVPSTGIISLTLTTGATDTGENFGNK